MTATEPRSAVAPSRRGRRSGRRREGGRAGFIATVTGLLLVVGAVGMQTLALDDEARLAPLTYLGAKGEIVDAGRFTARLDSFSAAKSIQIKDKTIGTDNLFLIVNVSAKSLLKPYHMGQPVLMTADGKRFDATDRVENTLTLANTWVQPDIWVSGRFFFEVPASALPDARVVLALPEQAGLVEAFQPEVEVDLGLDEEAARKLAASPQDVYSTDKK
ncbi:hypothetical protein [Nonomuraea sp. NPDC050643]|uniref:hypothetical protein n=1 Tax=Nonomuraea sp. NPDC050643 TaxID=3155660 RepID=UPI0033E7F60F